MKVHLILLATLVATTEANSCLADRECAGTELCIGRACTPVNEILALRRIVDSGRGRFKGAQETSTGETVTLYKRSPEPEPEPDCPLHIEEGEDFDDDDAMAEAHLYKRSPKPEPAVAVVEALQDAHDTVSGAINDATNTVNNAVDHVQGVGRSVSSFWSRLTCLFGCDEDKPNDDNSDDNTDGEEHEGQE